MRAGFVGCFALLLCFLAVDDASAQLLFSRNTPRGPKTLGQWRGAPESEEPAEENPRIITDRPNFAEATTTVGLGRVQIENGYTYSRDDEGGTRVQVHSFPETLIRLGVFREWFELRLGYNYFNEKTSNAGATTKLSGFDDIYLGAKVAMT